MKFAGNGIPHMHPGRRTVRMSEDLPRFSQQLVFVHRCANDVTPGERLASSRDRDDRNVSGTFTAHLDPGSTELGDDGHLRGDLHSLAGDVLAVVRDVAIDVGVGRDGDAGRARGVGPGGLCAAGGRRRGRGPGRRARRAAARRGRRGTGAGRRRAAARRGRGGAHRRGCGDSAVEVQDRCRLAAVQLAVSGCLVRAATTEGDHGLDDLAGRPWIGVRTPGGVDLDRGAIRDHEAVTRRFVVVRPAHLGADHHITADHAGSGDRLGGVGEREAASVVHRRRGRGGPGRRARRAARRRGRGGRCRRRAARGPGGIRGGVGIVRVQLNDPVTAHVGLDDDVARPVGIVLHVELSDDLLMPLVGAVVPVVVDPHGRTRVGTSVEVGTVVTAVGHTSCDDALAGLDGDSVCCTSRSQGCNNRRAGDHCSPVAPEESGPPEAVLCHDGISF